MAAAIAEICDHLVPAGPATAERLLNARLRPRSLSVRPAVLPGHAPHTWWSRELGAEHIRLRWGGTSYSAYEQVGGTWTRVPPPSELATRDPETIGFSRLPGAFDP